MTTIAITLGIIGYLFICFCLYAIIYVGTGGKVPIFKRRPPKYIIRKGNSIFHYLAKHDAMYVRYPLTVFGRYVKHPIYIRGKIISAPIVKGGILDRVWIGPKINPEERDPFGKVAKEYGSAAMQKIDGIVEGEENEAQQSE
jgi:hypothetical protein